MVGTHVQKGRSELGQVRFNDLSCGKIDWQSRKDAPSMPRKLYIYNFRIAKIGIFSPGYGALTGKFLAALDSIGYVQEYCNIAASGKNRKENMVVKKIRSQRTASSLDRHDFSVSFTRI